MKKIKFIPILAIIGIASFMLFGSVNANDLTDTNYRLTMCKINFPDGTFHLGAHCIEPEAGGPCDRQSVCLGGAPPPQILP